MVMAALADNAVYAGRLKHRQASAEPSLWNLLDQVHDPEIPGLSLWDLGVLRDVQQNNGQISVEITPTYCGCPAMEVMKDDIRQVLQNNGYSDIKITVNLSPPWGSDWISPNGRKALKANANPPR